MPYSTRKHKGCPRNKPWATVKDSDGSVIGCHPSRTAARAQQRALYANEGKSLEKRIVERAPEPKKEELLPFTDDMNRVFAAVARQYHPDLDVSRIEFFSRKRAPIEGGVAMYGQVDIENKFYPEADFVIWMAEDMWQTLTEHQKHAIADHELHHCLYDKDGVPYLSTHDVEEFNDVIARYGIWWKHGEGTIEAIASLSKENEMPGLGDHNVSVDVADEPSHTWICPHLAARPKMKGGSSGSTGAGGSSGSTGAGQSGSSGAGGSSGSTGAGQSGSSGAGGSSGSTGAGGSSGSTGAGGSSGSTGAVTGDHFSIPISDNEWIALCPDCFVMAARSIFEDLLEGI